MLRPISPRPEPPVQLPKSKTFAVLSSLSHSFSITSLSSNRQVSCPARTGDPTTSEVRYSPPHGEFTTNVLQVHAAQPSSYWCGRYQALSDRFQHEDAVIRNRYLSTMGEEPITNTYPPLHEVIKSTPLRQVSTQSSGSSQPIIISRPRRISARSTKVSLTFARVMEDDDRRSQRILTYLQELCYTNAARKSFWNWQVDYARAMKNKVLLPHGGRMTDEKGWIGRVGRVISDGIGSGGTGGRGTGLGKRSAFGFRRARSGLDMP